MVGEPDAYAGELPVAFVTLKPGVQIAADALLADVAPRVYERPAVPKRVTVLDALPMTAIGKIFKPALRRLAAQAKLGELLADEGVSVLVEDRAGRLHATVRIGGPPDEARAAYLHAKLATIAMPLELDFSG